MILGIDEAGRGCVIGPMVICGVTSISESIMLPVRDSKKLCPKKRQELYEKINQDKDLNTVVIQIDVSEIDKKNLNTVCKETAIKIINIFRPDRVYLDVPARGMGIEKYCKVVCEGVTVKTIIVGENKADDKYAIVSAASIVAKVVRDRKIEQLKEIYGNFGSGYPSDPITQEFLKNHKDLPIVRQKWKTVKRLNYAKVF